MFCACVRSWLTPLVSFPIARPCRSSAYLYITFITNISQCWALYCLALFYFALKNELKFISPVGKVRASKKRNTMSESN